jgi:hypothetical protein
MAALEDTQPRSPFRDQVPPVEPPLEGDEEQGGPGCLLWSLMGLIALGCALVIVLLAGAAGWTSGQRTAQANATATQNADVQIQLARIPVDVASGNQFLLSRRLEFLATLTPGVPGVTRLIQTATALAVKSQPTRTSVPTATPTATALAPTAESTETPVSATTQAGYDLNALLQQAQSAFDSRDWGQAMDTLDAIISIDANFQTDTVRGLMLQSLESQARADYNSGKLAEAIALTNRAGEFGLPQNSDLWYEQYAAGLYLDATRTIGTDYPSAIQALHRVVDLGPGRYYDKAKQLLFQQYVAYGDAWVAQTEYCPAAVQYDSALSLFASSAVNAKRDNANTLCSQATPVPGPGVTPGTPGTPPAITPVGATG